jgi:hypothetical protein
MLTSKVKVVNYYETDVIDFRNCLVHWISYKQFC